jgi:hypothetical protein
MSTELAAGDTPDSGWLLFASLMLAIGGGYNVIAGVVALWRPGAFKQDAVYPFSDLHTWGWILLVLGALEIVAAFIVVSGSQFARWYGVFAAGMNGISQLFFIHAIPVVSLMIFGAEILVIYALAAHGGRRAPAGPSG